MRSARCIVLAAGVLWAGCAAIAGLDEEFVVGVTSSGSGSPSGSGGLGVGGGTAGTAGTGATMTGTPTAAGGGAAAGGAGASAGFGGSGGSGGSVYTSCQQVLDQGQSSGSQTYWIDTPSGPKSLYCDMDVDGGGWILVGQVSGKQDNYDTWLRSDVATANLATPAIESATFSCIDAVPMAVQVASEIRLSNSAIDRWVKWPLIPGRTLVTWWNHSAGYATIEAAADSAVTVVAHSGETDACYQNVYGIMPWDMHGGSYPSAPRNEAGNTSPDDWCMAIGVLQEGGNAHGFGSNNNGYDAPADETTWPNTDYNSPPNVSVWLR